jgi:hypothetical protein
MHILGPLQLHSGFGVAVRDFVPGGIAVQTAQPRDFGALALVVGLFVILLLVTLTLGGPAAAIR